LSKDENLLEIAVASGLDSTKAANILADPARLTEVAMLESQMSKLGITGVPFYIINKKYGISGAQPIQHFIEVLKETSAEIATTDSCSVEANDC
jgi:predicted DsbA family dithiol-disulfide isomerase